MSDQNFKILEEQIFMPTAHLVNWIVILLIGVNLAIPLSNRLPEAYHGVGGMGFFLLGILAFGLIIREMASYYQYIVLEESFLVDKCWGKRRRVTVIQLKFADITYYGPIQKAEESPVRRPRRYIRQWKKASHYALDYRVGEGKKRIILQNSSRLERVMARMLRGRVKP